MGAFVFAKCARRGFCDSGWINFKFLFHFLVPSLTRAFSKVKSKCEKLLHVVALCHIFQAALLATTSSCRNLNWAKHPLCAETKGVSQWQYF